MFHLLLLCPGQLFISAQGKSNNASKSHDTLLLGEHYRRQRAAVADPVSPRWESQHTSVWLCKISPQLIQRMIFHSPLCVTVGSPLPSWQTSVELDNHTEVHLRLCPPPPLLTRRGLMTTCSNLRNTLKNGRSSPKAVRDARWGVSSEPDILNKVNAFKALERGKVEVGRLVLEGQTFFLAP